VVRALGDGAAVPHGLGQRHLTATDRPRVQVAQEPVGSLPIACAGTVRDPAWAIPGGVTFILFER
jgi:hypothetical protein